MSWAIETEGWAVDVPWGAPLATSLMAYCDCACCPMIWDYQSRYDLTAKCCCFVNDGSVSALLSREVVIWGIKKVSVSWSEIYRWRRAGICFYDTRHELIYEAINYVTFNFFRHRHRFYEHCQSFSCSFNNVITSSVIIHGLIPTYHCHRAFSFKQYFDSFDYLLTRFELRSENGFGKFSFRIVGKSIICLLSSYTYKQCQ